jgi:eukaryotic-like serine/threonine-protein kinase
MIVDPFGWVGGTLAEKYRVGDVIGEGGFAVVYRGMHEGLAEPVAIKCLKMPPTLGGDERERFRQTFLDEGRLLYRLSRSHDAIVLALDVGTAESPRGAWTPYLVLEWLDGKTLRDELVDRRKQGLPGYSLGQALALIEPVAGALATAHAQRVAHRDIKPANLFLQQAGGRTRMKVLDFGIAKVLRENLDISEAFEATGQSLKAFTPQYGAPEQFDRKRGATGPWTDVYALALVFVELVTGREALEGDDVVQLMIATTDRKVRPTLGAKGYAAPREIDAVLEKALAVEPRDRYASAGELWQALVAAAALPVPPRVSLVDGTIAETPRDLGAALAGATGPHAGQSGGYPAQSVPGEPTSLYAAAAGLDLSASADVTAVELPSLLPDLPIAPAPVAQDRTPIMHSPPMAYDPTPVALPPFAASPPHSPGAATRVPAVGPHLPRIPAPPSTRRRRESRPWVLALAVAGVVGAVALLAVRLSSSSNNEDDDDERGAHASDVRGKLPPAPVRTVATAATGSPVSPGPAKVELAPAPPRVAPNAPGAPARPASNGGQPDMSLVNRCLAPGATTADCDAATRVCGAAGDFQCLARVQARRLELDPPVFPLPVPGDDDD